MDKKRIIESLSANEVKILPFLEEGSLDKISEVSGLDKISVSRALEYLENKKIVSVISEKKKIIDLGVNGILYKRRGLPERKIMELLKDKKAISMKDAKKKSSLSDEEFKASIGILKRKDMIDLKNENILLNCNGEKISKKSLEEIFIETLPMEESNFSEEQKIILKDLVKRKEIIKISEEKSTFVEVTKFGKSFTDLKLKTDFIEQITPEILKKDSNWKGKKFRRYDVDARVPKVFGGKRHFVLQAGDYARGIWRDMGFEEMSGDMVVSSLWNFDSLFTPQDHPVREMQDTFFLYGNLRKDDFPDKKLVESIKNAHEGKIKSLGSKGWNYSWSEDKARKLVLRTHTTILSAQTLAKLKDTKNLPRKFFALGKCFRNETLDWSHGFEFNQTEGIVIDRGANFRHLLGYLKQFFHKMGFEKLRFRPAYFPYTEPSVEIDVYHEEKKTWLELGGAGIFRPEVVVPLLGENIPVLAWGPGFDRTIMDYYEIKDLRELYKNDVNKLRNMKSWMK
ncbi:MAG: phenylalanine--tRNA ligase subunit alpha [Candidatus Pacearchaeota archaeon]